MCVCVCVCVCVYKCVCLYVCVCVWLCVCVGGGGGPAAGYRCNLTPPTVAPASVTQGKIVLGAMKSPRPPPHPRAKTCSINCHLTTNKCNSWITKWKSILASLFAWVFASHEGISCNIWEHKRSNFHSHLEGVNDDEVGFSNLMIRARHNACAAGKAGQGHCLFSTWGRMFSTQTGRVHFLYNHKNGGGGGGGALGGGILCSVHTNRDGAPFVNHTNGGGGGGALFVPRKNREGALFVQHTNREGALLVQHTNREGALFAQHTNREGALSVQHTNREGALLVQHTKVGGALFVQHKQGGCILCSAHKHGTCTFCSAHKLEGCTFCSANRQGWCTLFNTKGGCTLCSRETKAWCPLCPAQTREACNLFSREKRHLSFSTERQCVLSLFSKCRQLGASVLGSANRNREGRFSVQHRSNKKQTDKEDGGEGGGISHSSFNIRQRWKRCTVC